jgi:hypothetical protein
MKRPSRKISTPSLLNPWLEEPQRIILEVIEPPFWIRKGLAALGIMGLLFLGFVFLPWTQNIPAVGRVTSLTPNVRPQTIHAMIPGRIARWYTEEGKRVRAGDTILVISEIKDYYLRPRAAPPPAGSDNRQRRRLTSAKSKDRCSAATDTSLRRSPRSCPGPRPKHAPPSRAAL